MACNDTLSTSVKMHRVKMQRVKMQRVKPQRKRFGCTSALLALYVIALSTAQAAEAEISYDVSLKGAPDKLIKSISSYSKLLNDKKYKPETLGVLRRTAEADRLIFEKALRAEGYYSARADVFISPENKEIELTYILTSGPLFKITSVDLSYNENITSKPQSISDLGLSLPTNARAATVNAFYNSILNYYQQNGYPFAEITEKKVLADFEDGTASLSINLRTGKKNFFGPIEWQGAGNFRRTYLDSFIEWEENDIFKLEELTDLRVALARTDLFNNVSVSANITDETSDRAPVLIKLDERPHRTIGGGLSFSTNLGPGVQLYWEHRNIFHRGAKLRVNTQANTERQNVHTSLNIPGPQQNRNWISELLISNSMFDAFDEKLISLTSGVEQKINQYLDVSVAISIEMAEVKAEGITSETGLISLPLKAIYRDSDNLLNPRKGGYASLQATPYVGNVEGDGFVTLEAQGAYWYPLGSTPKVEDEFDKRIVAGLWTQVGATIAGDENDIPVNKRFFAGGGGSIRGFGYQFAGPVNSDNDPTGGTSVFAIGTELRKHVRADLQVAIFAETGAAFDDPFPSFDGELFTGVGAGVRYITPVGPIRFDVAVPVNPRNDIDDSVQIYINIGQAF